MSTTKDKLALEDAEVSYYKNAWGDNDSQAFLTTREWLEGTMLGTWKDHVLAVRKQLGNKEKYDKLKRDGAGVTPGARFTHRKKGGELAYTGLMVIDLDHLDEDRQSVKALMKLDPYTYAGFDSIGGQGLCLLFRVDNARWDESFLGIQEYLGKKYGLFEKFDQSGKDISRLRFVSYDPDGFVKEVLPPVFKEYPKKETKQKHIPDTFIHTQEDFDYVFQQVIDTGVDITPFYAQRLKVCFALIDKFGEGGWPYFNRICQNHAEYDEKKSERMWKSALNYGAQKVTIKTFYYFCKEANLDIARPTTREITSIAAAHKKQGGTVKGTVETLKKMQGFDPAETEPIVRQVYECREEFKTDETLFDQLEMFLRSNYPMRRNEITRYIEDEQGRGLVETDFNGIWVHAVKVLGKEVSDKMVTKLIHSPFTQSYNPLKSFFAQHADRKPKGVIKDLAETIQTSSGFEENAFMPGYAEFIIRKWLIGLIASVYGHHCPIVLVLTGKPNTGKTEWFRRLLPKELHAKYFAETTWPVNKDTDILMAESWITFNDEWKGQTVKDPEVLKGYASADWFSLREPYGHSNVKRRRMAVMCGTSNPTNIIKDPDNNRKIFGINVQSIDFEAYNAIDKIDLLMEAYHAYMSKESQYLTSKEIEQINQEVKGFENHSVERLLIEKYYVKPENIKDAELCSQGDALVYLRQMSGFSNLDKDTITREFRTLGFQYQDKPVYYAPDGKVKRGFWIYKTSLIPSSTPLL
ncbi:BT4734/BF3469 family protein [Spirosoma harenae]